MELSPKTAETYAGRQLVELLEYATSDLEPDTGFSLELKGLSALPVMHKDLEAYFEASLDSERGADIALEYDPALQQMILKNLSFAINGMNGRAHLMKTDDFGYMPIVEFADQQMTFTLDKNLSANSGSVLLAGLGVTEFVKKDPVSYRLWKTDVMAKTSAWQIIEQLEIPLAFGGEFIESVVLSHTASVDLSKSDIHQVSKMTKSIIAFTASDEEGPVTHHTEMSIESIRDLDEHDLPILTTTYRKHPDILAKGGYKVTDKKIKALPLDESTFQDIKSTLKEAIAVRKAA